MIKSRRNCLAALVGTAAIVPTAKLPTPATVYEHLKSCWTWYETKEILNALPIRKNGITARNEAPFTVLSDFRRDLLQLNPIAASIWDLCDGRNGLDTMVRRVAGDYDVSPSACVNDVILTLRTFKRKGLITC